MAYCPNPDCDYLRDSGSPAEFRAGSVRCHHCGEALAEGDPPPLAVPAEPEAEAEADEIFTPDAGEVADGDDVELVPLLKLDDYGQAVGVESLLESAGIPFVVTGDRAQNLIGMGRLGTGYNVATGPPTLLVASTRLEEARALIADAEARAGSDGDDPETGEPDEDSSP